MKLLALFFLTAIPVLAIEVGNGKSIVLKFEHPSGTLSVDERNVSVVPNPADPKQGIAILPIDYHTPAHLANAHWSAEGSHVAFDINVTAAIYPIETLSVDSAKVSPPPEMLQRIAEEKAEAEGIYHHYTAERYWDKPFIRPIDSITTSAYGSSRTYNGFFKSYHGGVDFRALTPLPILASNDGIVVLAKDRYYSGGTIIIDHGQGLYTCYFHLSEYHVKVGDKVALGQEIALSGATGRITGPHLHFAVMVHGVQSDPIDLLAQINKLFEFSTAQIAHSYNSF